MPLLSSIYLPGIRSKLVSFSKAAPVRNKRRQPPAGRTNPGGDGMKPRPAVLIRQRLAMMHLLDVGLRMEPVAVFIDPMQPVGEHRCNRALAAAGNSHHQDDGRITCRRVRLHDGPPTLQRGPPATRSRLANRLGSPEGPRTEST